MNKTTALYVLQTFWHKRQQQQQLYTCISDARAELLLPKRVIHAFLANFADFNYLITT